MAFRNPDFSGSALLICNNTNFSSRLPLALFKDPEGTLIWNYSFSETKEGLLEI